MISTQIFPISNREILFFWRMAFTETPIHICGYILSFNSSMTFKHKLKLIWVFLYIDKKNNSFLLGDPPTLKISMKPEGLSNPNGGWKVNSISIIREERLNPLHFANAIACGCQVGWLLTKSCSLLWQMLLIHIFTLAKGTLPMLTFEGGQL